MFVQMGKNDFPILLLGHILRRTWLGVQALNSLFVRI